MLQASYSDLQIDGDCYERLRNRGLVYRGTTATKSTECYIDMPIFPDDEVDQHHNIFGVKTPKHRYHTCYSFMSRAGSGKIEGLFGNGGIDPSSLPKFRGTGLIPHG